MTINQYVNIIQSDMSDFSVSASPQPLRCGRWWSPAFRKGNTWGLPPYSRPWRRWPPASSCSGCCSFSVLRGSEWWKNKEKTMTKTTTKTTKKTTIKLFYWAWKEIEGITKCIFILLYQLTKLQWCRMCEINLQWHQTWSTAPRLYLQRRHREMYRP